MKLKGINVFEQHVEKIFAGAIFAAFLVLLAWQFVSRPATVTVNKREVPLNQAWETVAEESRRVQANLNSTRAPDALDAAAATEQIVKFNDTYRGPLTPSKTLAIAIGESTNLGSAGGTVASTIAPLAELVVPAPSAPYGSAHLTLISPLEAEGKPEVAAILPKAMPFDKAGVTVEAAFNGGDLLDSLTVDPDGDGPIRAMPRHWWDGAIQIVDVELQREELGANGVWGGQKTIAPLPGRFSLREDLTQPFEGAAQLKERAKTATEFAEYIRRPPYYASAMGEKWMTPAERRDLEDRLAAQAGTADDAARIRRQLDGKREELQRSEQELANLGAGGGARPPQERPRPSPPPNPGGKGTGGGGGGAPPSVDRNQPPRDTTEQKRKGLERRIDQAKRDIASLIERLRAMGEDVSMYGAAEAAPVDTNAPAKAEAPLLENHSVRIWSHDVFVERGKTYRYRMVVVLNNPMFGQGNVMVPAQQEWSKAAVVRSAPSEWSEPIRVDDETYYFITSANAADRMNRTQGARAEMFIFKWGRWRKGDAQLEPGDRLRADVKYPDVSALLAMLPSGGGEPGRPAIPGFPAPPPAPSIDPGSGGGKRAPGAPPPPSPAPNPSQQDNRRPGGEREPVPGPGAGRPEGANPPKAPALPMLTEKVAVDAIFLSVAAAQAVEAEGRTRSGMVAYLRNDQGQIVPRYPDAERGSVTLARLERSASQGLLDVQPNEPKVSEPPRPQPKERPQPKAPDPGGGGGGGA